MLKWLKRQLFCKRGRHRYRYDDSLSRHHSFRCVRCRNMVTIMVKIMTSYGDREAAELNMTKRRGLRLVVAKDGEKEWIGNPWPKR